MGLREAHEHHLPDITLAALRYARANDPTFPDPADKRGAELLYRVGDLKKWARNRPRAASGTTEPGAADAVKRPCPVQLTRPPSPGETRSPGPAQKWNTAP